MHRSGEAMGEGRVDGHNAALISQPISPAHCFWAKHNGEAPMHACTTLCSTIVDNKADVDFDNAKANSLV